MMYGKFSFFFFQILHTCTNEAKNFESGNKNVVSSGMDSCIYTNMLIHARTLKINYL